MVDELNIFRKRITTVGVIVVVNVVFGKVYLKKIFFFLAVSAATKTSLARLVKEKYVVAVKLTNSLRAMPISALDYKRLYINI